MPVNTTTVFSVFSFLGMVISCIPLYWHLEAWNVGTCMFMIWTAIACLIQFVYSIVWNGNVVNWAPVFCDITTRIYGAYGVAIPAAALCINRRLYYIASPSSVQMHTKKEKRRQVIVDLLICLGIPVLSMVTEYIVSGHRYNIWEDFGCSEAVYNTWVAYPLLIMWPLVLETISAFYSASTLVAFWRRRRMFRDLISVNSNLTYSRYFRLIAFTLLDLTCSIPVSVYVIHYNITFGHGLYPWISWSDTHFGYSRYYQITKADYSVSHELSVQLELGRWSCVIWAVIFFGFFGFAEEAKKNYRLAFGTISKAVGYSSSSSAPGSFATSSFPAMRGDTSLGGGVSVSLNTNYLREKGKSRRSLSSMSDKFSTSIYIDEAECRTPNINKEEYPDLEIAVSPVLPSSKEAEAAVRAPDAVYRKASVPDAPKSVYPDSVLDV